MAKVDFGAAVEHKFAAEAMLRGHMVSWPSSQLHPYDLIVDNGKRCFRVQVKGSNIHRDTIPFSFRKMDTRRVRRRYQKEEIDAIALYIAYTDTWYILPIENVKASIRFRPLSANCRSKKYANAWHFFD